MIKDKLERLEEGFLRRIFLVFGNVPSSSLLREVVGEEERKIREEITKYISPIISSLKDSEMYIKDFSRLIEDLKAKEVSEEGLKKLYSFFVYRRDLRAKEVQLEDYKRDLEKGLDLLKRRTLVIERVNVRYDGKEKPIHSCLQSLYEEITTTLQKLSSLAKEAEQQTEKFLKIDYQEVITMFGEDITKEFRKIEKKLFKTFYKAEKVEEVEEKAKELYEKRIEFLLKKLEVRAEKGFKELEGYKKALEEKVLNLYERLKSYKEVLGESVKSYKQLSSCLPKPDSCLNSIEEIGIKLEEGKETCGTEGEKREASQIKEILFKLRDAVKAIKDYEKEAGKIRSRIETLENPYESLKEGLTKLSKTSMFLFLTYFDFYTKELPKRLGRYEKKGQEFEKLKKETENLLGIDIKKENWEEALKGLGEWNVEVPIKREAIVSKINSTSKLKKTDTRKRREGFEPAVEIKVLKQKLRKSKGVEIGKETLKEVLEKTSKIPNIGSKRGYELIFYFLDHMKHYVEEDLLKEDEKFKKIYDVWLDSPLSMLASFEVCGYSPNLENYGEDESRHRHLMESNEIIARSHNSSRKILKYFLKSSKEGYKWNPGRVSKRDEKEEIQPINVQSKRKNLVIKLNLNKKFDEWFKNKVKKALEETKQNS